MSKIFKFAVREYKAAVKTKGFIIGLIIAPIFMGGGLIAFLLLKDRVDTRDKYAVIVDRSGLIAESISEAAEYRNINEIFKAGTGEKIKPAYFFEVVKPTEGQANAQRLELSDRVRRGELHSFLEIGSQVIHPEEGIKSSKIAYYSNNAALDDMRDWLTWPINNRLRKLRLEDAGIDENRVKDLFYWVPVEGLNLVSVDESTGMIADAQQASPIEAVAVPIVIMMLLFLMIMMSVPGMLHSVMEEKTQRIAEVLLGSIKPFELMMAKLLGGIAVSLTSSLVYFIAGFIAIKYTGIEHFIPLHVLPWFFVYMLLAIVMFGAISSALGATCNEAKDAQSLTFPSLLPALIPMFIYFPVVKEPLSNFSTWMSLFPTFTPLLMVLRLSTPDQIPFWQPYVGLLGVVLCTVFFVWAGGRIFRIAILTQGTPPKVSNIIRWAIKG